MRLVRASTALLLSGCLVAGCSSESGDDSAESAPTTGSSAPAASEPSFDGTFKADYGPATSINGEGPMEGTARTDTWVARSVCRDNGCVATVSAVNPEDPGGPATMTKIFDYIGDRWVSVDVASRPCPGAAGDVETEDWLVMALEPRPDGKLSGPFSWTSAKESCMGRQTLTLSRIDDADPAPEVADPAGQPPRIPSAAEGLRGSYIRTSTNPATGEEIGSQTYRGDTRCLRTGDRCMSLLAQDENVLALVFADALWTESFTVEEACSDGTSMAKKVSTTEIPLPEPTQDPIPVLTGKQRQEFSGGCYETLELDVKLERTGD